MEKHIDIDASGNDDAEGAGASGEPPSNNPKPDTSKFITDCLYANELGDGILFAHLHKGKFICNKSSGEWLRWDEHHWVLDVEDMARAGVEDVAQSYIREAFNLVGKIDWAIKGEKKDLAAKYKERQKLIYKRVSRLRSNRGRSNTMDFGKTNPTNPLQVLGDVFDQQPWLLPCTSGVVNLRTGELRPGRQNDYLIKCAPTEWRGINAPAPVWEQFLSEIFFDDAKEEDAELTHGQEMIGYIQRLFGYAITGLTIEHVLPIFWGRGRNGKGTLIESINSVLGPLSGPVPAEMLLAQPQNKSASAPSPEVMALRGQRIAFASETDENRAFSPSRIKWFSGGDTLTARAPHDRYQTTFRPTHLLILMTNNKPHTPADDFALWERIHLVPFSWAFVDRDPAAPNERRADKYLLEKLKQEASGILAWMVRGCIAWQEHGLMPPAAVRAATEEYRMDEDPLAGWMEECCHLAPDARANATYLYESFKTWWEDHVSKKVPSHKTFGKWMKVRFHSEKHGVYMYYGIRLLQDTTG